MPSALETLVKILKLEREQGYKNNAVIGGLSAYGHNWARLAHQQARKLEHHKLVDELTKLLNKYDLVDNREERHSTVAYMLDRITGRVPAPPEYQVSEEERMAQSTAPDSPPPRPTSAPTERPERRDKKERRREQKPSEAVEAAPTASTDERRSKNAPREQAPAEGRSRPKRQEQPAPEGTTSEDQPQSSSYRGERTQEQGREKRERGNNAARNEGSRKPPRQPQRPPMQSRKGSTDDDEDAENTLQGEFVADHEEFGDPYFRKGGPVLRFEPDIPPMPRLARAPRRPRPAQSLEAAADIMRGLDASAEKIRGVGPRLGKTLEKLNIETINDLLFFLPRRYDDYTHLSYISRLQPNQQVTVIGTVRSTQVRIARGGRKDFFMELDDGSGVLNITFFGQHWMMQRVRRGMQIALYGKTSIFGNRLQMTNPEWEEVDAESLRTPSIVPVYPLTEGLSAKMMRRVMKGVVDYWSEHLPDYVPEATLERAELGDLGWALKHIHFPAGTDHLEHARRRLIFDELLLLQLAILGNRREWQSVPAVALPVDDGFLDQFIDTVFPYPLTGAQQRAIMDIRQDISTTTPMNRLLQGDVGAGKTAVAVTAMAMAFSSGKQAALMAPTSILAEQHYRSISRALDKMPGDRRPVIGMLTSALSTGEREGIYNGLADGSIDIVIGTHALIQEGVAFHDLALVVIDEQHRFGTAQRAALRSKGTNPHLLVMTATPIPRTLALTLYADLDLSIMDEMPPGRIPIQTRVVEPVERERIYSFVETQLKQGRQAFIVYPLVEASEKIDAQSALEAYEHLKQVFFRYKVGLLHGRMRPLEKDEIMAQFANHEFDVLVTTSVAEVGVDIPNASTIIIEGANRFGLATLHQFRGRVGRGQFASYCLLIPDNNSSEAMERLAALEATTDGFRLAEIDWKLRGPGDLVGTRQSGQAQLRLLESMTPDLVALAQREARTIYEEDPELLAEQHRLLAQRVQMLYREGSDHS